MLQNNKGIYTIDSHYGRAQMAAVYLIKDEDAGIIIETANNKSLIYTQQVLEQSGLTPADIKYIILTHIHLDHAGGASSYMDYFYNAQLIVHPKGTRHMINPEILEYSVSQVYGAKFVEDMYGKLKPIAKERIISAEDGFSLTLNQRKITCRHTPGHANHHLAIIDETAKAVFTGDVFGVAYPELINQDGERFIFPTTTPVNFNPQLMHQSLDLINSYNLITAYPTHFGALENIPKYTKILHQMVDDYVEIVITNKSASNRVDKINEKLNDYLWQQAQNFGIILDKLAFNAIIEMDSQINAQGLDVWLTQA